MNKDLQDLMVVMVHKQILGLEEHKEKDLKVRDNKVIIYLLDHLMEEQLSHINNGEIGMMLLTNYNYKNSVVVEMDLVTFRIHLTKISKNNNLNKIIHSHLIVTQM